MKKIKQKTAFPEMTLTPSDRRKRAKRMSAITTGNNPLTARMIRRLPSRPIPSKHSARKEMRQLKRYERAGYAP